MDQIWKCEYENAQRLLQNTYDRINKQNEEIERLRNALRHVLIESQDMDICEMVSKALEGKTE